VIDGYSLPDPFGYRWAMGREVSHPFHERCGSAHWPEEECFDRTHTASAAVGYLMDIDRARREAQCEGLGAREGLRAVTASHSVAELGAAHNRFASAWGQSDRTLDDTAVLHGFMAVVRPVLAEASQGEGLEAEAGLGDDVLKGVAPLLMASLTCTGCKGGDCGSCTDRDCACARHPRGHARTGAKDKVRSYIDEMAKEYHVAPFGK
jgi:hypothetical protein